MMVGAVLTLGGCQKPDGISTPTDPTLPVLSKIPDNFSFASDQDVAFRITALTNRNNPMVGVPFSVYSLPDNQLLFSGVTSANGVFEMKHRLANHLGQVEIRTTYPGIPSSQVITLSSNQVVATFGGSNPGGRISAEASVTASISNTRIPNIKTLGSWNNNGLPNYLVSNTPDAIEQAFYDRITASLPESKPLSTTHPEYIANNAPTTLDITELADVWVTFVTEGAGWKNSLGFYTYDKSATITSVNQLQNPTIIFPNVSMVGSNGSLVSGHRVHIGRFPAGTSIGFFMLADAYNTSNGDIAQGNYAHFSHSALNSESDPNKRRHFVVLNDVATDRVLLAVEDVSLMNTPIVCDNDYNDAVFYITSNPVTAVDKTPLPTTDKPTDTDGDEIPDPRDEYPTDKDRAFNVYTPAKDVYGTLAYEDLWPSKGDYDFNDLVMSYNFQEVLNAKNEIVDVKTKLKVRAIGASFKNGWGIQMPVAASNIKTAKSTDTRTNTTKTLTSEAGQTNITLIPFQNAYDMISAPATSLFVNTESGKTTYEGKIFTVDLTFNTPVTRAALGTAPYNTFLIARNERGREIHLANHQPTTKANVAYFGTGNDKTNPGLNKFYKDDSNMPWALNIPVEFDYPFERTSILNTHLNFFQWAATGGAQYKDWYMNKTNYRKTENIFKK